MNQATHFVRQGVRLGTLLVCVLAIGVGMSGAQFKPAPPPLQPPNPPKIPLGPPIANRPKPGDNVEWFCTRCRHSLGVAPVQPDFAVCPNCGVSFKNHTNKTVYAIESIIAIVIGGVVLVVVALVGVVAVASVWARVRPKKKKTKKVKYREGEELGRG